MLKAKKEELEERGYKGFTLMEMLIVVAIIAVLVAIAIPVFTSQLERAREQADIANLRSAYAVAAAEVLLEDQGVSAGPVTLQQTGSWEHLGANEKIGPVDLSTVAPAGQMYVNVGTDGSVKIEASPNSAYKTVDPVNGSSVTNTTNP